MSIQFLQRHSVSKLHELINAEAEFNLDAEHLDVLPLLSRAHLLEALRRIPPHEIEQTLQQQILPVAWSPGFVFYACCGPQGIAYAADHGLRLVAEVGSTDFHYAVRSVWGKKLLNHATFYLCRANFKHSAKRRVTSGQIAMFIGMAMAIAAGIALLPHTAALALINAGVGLFFLSIVALRLFCVLPGNRPKQKITKRLSNRELPTYSVLVPMFLEAAVLNQLLSALTQLNYPADKLDIKIIVEESDTTLRRALERFELPDFFELIVVPRGKPQTKPRALNYALQFARGELLTIYDAEDIPESNQLRLAAQRFGNSGENLACLQAQLVFFNANENWLTRQFTAEYATLFGLILPALAEQGLPLPLGGTSNHFRTDILRKIGAWDPYNVTEDADLGMRLSRLGYETDVIDSLTYEEANTQFMNWTRQRARWLKGFLQTWLVHMRNPIKLIGEIGLSGFWVLQCCTIGIFVSALFHPFLLAYTIYALGFNPLPTADDSILPTLLGGMNLALFVIGYAVTMFAAHKAMRLRGLWHWWGTIATMPIYWLIMSIAAWLALWQFIVAPFEWNKTEHGLSKLQKH